MLNKLRKYTRSAIVWTVILMLIVCMVPGGMFGDNVVGATNNITIYFDPSGSANQCGKNSSHQNHGWDTANMTTLYYHAFNSSGGTGLTAAELTDIVRDGGSGKLFKVTVDVDTYTGILFRTNNTWYNRSDGDNRWQTENIAIDASKNNHVFKLNGNLYTDNSESGKFKQGIYDDGVLQTTPDEPDMYLIHKSGTDVGEQTFYNSELTLNNVAQSTNNIKTGSNYDVGEYTYTDRYMTYPADFYDYLSDEEFSNGRGSITNSLSSGYTDIYTNLNQRLQYTASQVTTYTVDSNTVEVDIGEYSSTKENFYLYVKGKKNGTTYYILGEWKGTKFTDLSFVTGSETIAKIDVTGYTDVTVRLVHSNGNQTSDMNVTAGRRYRFNSWTVLADEGSSFSSVTASGTAYTIPLYFGCFWKSNSNSGYTSDNVPSYNNFQWPANISLRGSSEMSSSVTGLVKNTLVGGTVADKTTNAKLPYFDSAFAANNTDLVYHWDNIDFPFYEIELDKDRNGNEVRDYNNEKPVYYQFNSRDIPTLYLDTENDYNNGVKLYENEGRVMSQYSNTANAQTKGFYPYNKTSSTDAKKNNLGFGVKYTIPFVLTEDGKIKGVDTTFEFMGDDDVWVFLDDKLVLDMGGAHKDAYGVVNFAIDKQKSTLKSTFDVSAGTLTAASSSKESNKDTDIPFDVSDFKTPERLAYNTGKVHTITMFFMERGMLESDNFIRFNFTKQNVLTVTNELSVEGINDGLVNKTYEAANYDIFDYSLRNENITERPEEYGTNGLVYKGGRSEAVRKVYNLSNTQTGLNTTITEPQTADPSVGNFNWHNAGPVVSTYFERYDDYFVKKATDELEADAKKFVTGTTNASGVFELLYGQRASYKYQFFSNSTIKTVQKNELYKLDKSTRTNQDTLESRASVASGRLASNFYSTTWKLVDVDNVTLGQETTNQANTNGVAITDNNRLTHTTGQYTFSNSTEKATIGVNLTAEYVNKPLTGGLSIKKQIVNKGTTTPATDSYTGNFTIRVKLKDIFGQNSALGNVQLDQQSDYTGIKYTIDGNEYTMGYDSANNCGTITIQNGKTAIISDIPVSTGYEISEAADNTYALDSLYVNGTKVTGTTAEGTIVNSASPAAANTYNVNNTRGLGSLVVNKEITGIGASTDTTKFPVTLTITPPSGVQLTEYFSQATDVVQTNLTDYSATVNATGNSTFSFKVGNGSSLRLNNLPYGTTYSVTENLTGIDGYTQSTTIDDGDPDDAIVNTALENVTITNQKATPTFTLRITKRWSGINPGEKPDVADQYKTVYYLLRRSITGARGSWTDVTEDKAGNHIGETYKSDHDIKVVYDTTDVADATGNIINYTLVANLPVCDESGNLYYYRALEYNTSKSQVYSGSNYDTEGKYKVTYEARGVADGYIQMQETDAGTTQDWGAVNTSTTPYVPPIVMPATGGTPLIFLFPFGIIAITLSGAAMIIYKKKLQGTSLCVKKEGEE